MLLVLVGAIIFVKKNRAGTVNSTAQRGPRATPAAAFKPGAGGGGPLSGRSEQVRGSSIRDRDMDIELAVSAPSTNRTKSNPSYDMGGGTVGGVNLGSLGMVMDIDPSDDDENDADEGPDLCVLWLCCWRGLLVIPPLLEGSDAPGVAAPPAMKAPRRALRAEQLPLAPTLLHIPPGTPSPR